MAGADPMGVRLAGQRSCSVGPSARPAQICPTRFAPPGRGRYRSPAGLPPEADNSALPHSEPPGGPGFQDARDKTAGQCGFDGVSEGTRTPDTQDHNNVAEGKRPRKTQFSRDSWLNGRHFYTRWEPSETMSSAPLVVAVNAMLLPPSEQDVIVSGHQPHPAGLSLGRASRATAGSPGLQRADTTGMARPSHDLAEIVLPASVRILASRSVTGPR